MEDSYINNISQSFDLSNITNNCPIIPIFSPGNHHYFVYTPFDPENYEEEAGLIMKVVTCISICIGLPLTLMAIYALFSQVRNDHVAPIYVVNLLISDLIQFCCLIVEVTQPEDPKTNRIIAHIYCFCLGDSIGFMVCIALERYLVIACPLWYRFKRTIKISVVVCVVVWALPLVFFLSLSSLNYLQIHETVVAIICVFPIPFLLFSLGGTLKALSSSISVHSDEKRRIVGMLVLVLLIYTLLFLPSAIVLANHEAKCNETLRVLSPVFLRLSPLADLFLYVFMRKGVIDKLLASVCCCRLDSNDISSPPVEMMTADPESASGRDREKTEGDM